MEADTKLSTTQISIIAQFGGFLDIALLGITAAASAISAVI